MERQLGIAPWVIFSALFRELKGQLLLLILCSCLLPWEKNIIAQRSELLWGKKVTKINRECDWVSAQSMSLPCTYTQMLLSVFGSLSSCFVGQSAENKILPPGPRCPCKIPSLCPSAQTLSPWSPKLGSFSPLVALGLPTVPTTAWVPLGSLLYRFLIIVLSL